MTSFFEKLKKGMGVEIPKEEPGKTEKTKEKPSKDSAPVLGPGPAGQSPAIEYSTFFTEQVKSSPKKKRIKKLNPVRRAGTLDSGLSKPARQEAGLSNGVKIEADLINKTEKEEPKKSEQEESEKNPPDGGEEKEEKKQERSRPDFILQNLGGQEGQLAVDVYQTAAELVIRTAIAGVKAENLDISIEDDMVLIRGNRQDPGEQGEKNYFYQECYWGPFSRQIILPEETDPSRAEAVMKEGILFIRIPKIERQKKRKITIKS